MATTRRSSLTRFRTLVIVIAITLLAYQALQSTAAAEDRDADRKELSALLEQWDAFSE